MVPAAGAPGELLDMVSGRSLSIRAMLETRVDYQATVLPDGRVLITGGSLQSGSTEYFDPTSRAFTRGPSMNQGRQGHSALLLPDGHLLVAGGTDTPSPAELLEPSATQFILLPSEAKFGLSAALVALENGSVLMCDGMSGKTWIWDPQTRTSKSVGSLSSPRILFHALRLKNGRVLVTGGWPAPTEPRPFRPGWPQRKVSTTTLSSALPSECFDPSRKKWSTLKATLSPRARHTGALLSDGRVCLFAGFGTDTNAANESLEILDPTKETVNIAGTLPLKGHPGIGWCTQEGQFMALLEGVNELRLVPDPMSLAQPPRHCDGKLANSFLNPLLVPLKDRKLLVLGTPAWGPALERWDPRSSQCVYVGTLRAGTETLGILPDGKIVALSSVVDRVDITSGNLSPLGWRDDLAATLKKAKLYLGPATPLPMPPFPPKLALRNYLVVPMNKTQALVLGGCTLSGSDPVDSVFIWDLKKKTLSPTGSMKAKRSFASPWKHGEGALALKDGSVLIWSAN